MKRIGSLLAVLTVAAVGCGPSDAGAPAVTLLSPEGANHPQPTFSPDGRQVAYWAPSGTETANHLASWAGVAPGNNESAGKQRSGRTTKGNKPLSVALVQAAHAAAHTRNTYLSAQYHRLAGRRGKKRAIVAVAHTILVIADYLIKRKEPYRKLGGDYFDKRRPEATANRLVRRLEQLGYQVSLQHLSASVSA